MGIGRVMLGIGLPAVVASEAAAWRLSVRAPRSAEASTVIVLGYPSLRGGRLHPIQKWRTQIGARSLRPGGTLIFSGGATRGAARSEAEVMATYATSKLGVPDESIVIEDQARSTWENISFSLDLAAKATAIAVASDPFHAEKARRYIVSQRPELAERVVRADDYRPLERLWLKVPCAANHVRLMVLSKMRERRAGRTWA